MTDDTPWGADEQLGGHAEVLLYWYHRDGKGQRPSGERGVRLESEKDARIREVEQENRELRRTNNDARTTTHERHCEGGFGFFAKEVDPRPPL
ncbi:MAG: hypothetical protein ACRDQ5_08095 [Sciscionella sp.]